MKYHIYNGTTILASFMYESDRDVCLETFQEEYPDCKFTKDADGRNDA